MAFSKCMNFKSLVCNKEFFFIWWSVDLKRISYEYVNFYIQNLFIWNSTTNTTILCNAIWKVHTENILCNLTSAFAIFLQWMAHLVFKDHFSPLFFCAKMEKLTKVPFLWVGDAFSIMRYSAFSPTFSTGFNLQFP